MNKEKYVDAELKIVTFDYIDVISTSVNAEYPSIGDNDNILPSLGPDDTEIL